MLNRTQLLSTLLMFSISFSNSAFSASMEETIKFSLTGGSVCKVYAEEAGGDVEAFTELNLYIMQVAEKLGYTDDFQAFVSEIRLSNTILKTMLMEKYDTKADAYNDWCIRLYDGFQSGIAKAYE
jgi:hypothetical protein